MRSNYPHQVAAQSAHGLVYGDSVVVEYHQHVRLSGSCVVEPLVGKTAGKRAVAPTMEAEAEYWKKELEDAEKEMTDDVDSAIIAYMTSEMRNELLKLCFRKDKSVVMVPKVSDVLVRGASELNVLDGRSATINTDEHRRVVVVALGCQILAHIADKILHA